MIFNKDHATITDVGPTVDMLKVSFDLGFNISTTVQVRLARVLAPRDPIKNREAIDYLMHKIKFAKEMKVVVYKAGRTNNYLIDLFINSNNLNTDLIKKGYAKNYERKNYSRK